MHERGREEAESIYREVIPDVDPREFDGYRNARLAAHLGVRGVVPAALHLTLDDLPADVREAGRRLAPARPYAVLGVGTRVAIKRWPLESFAVLADRLHDDAGLEVVLVGDAGDARRARHLAEQMRVPPVSIAGRTGIPELAAVLGGARLYVGNDTAAAHLAAAMGVPAVVIVGGGHPGRFFPYPPGFRVYTVLHPVPCYGCDWHCHLPRPICITEISVDAVWQQVKAALRDSTRSETTAA